MVSIFFSDKEKSIHMKDCHHYMLYLAFFHFSKNQCKLIYILDSLSDRLVISKNKMSNQTFRFIFRSFLESSSDDILSENSKI